MKAYVELLPLLLMVCSLFVYANWAPDVDADGCQRWAPVGAQVVDDGETRPSTSTPSKAVRVIMSTVAIADHWTKSTGDSY